MKVVINVCYGGFGVSQKGYEKLIEWGIPAQKYIEEKRDPVTKLYLPEPKNDGEVIFDRELSDEDPTFDRDRYWETWLSDNRSHPLLVRLVEELGEEANGRFSKLKIVEIPDGVDWEIDEYDGFEHIAEVHRTWG